MDNRYFQGFSAGFYDNVNPIGVPPDRADDNIIGGNNAFITERGTWAKKPGMTRWSSVAISSGNSVLDWYDHIYSATVKVIGDRLNDVVEFTPSSLVSFYAKTNTLRASFVSAGDKLYFGFGDFVSPDVPAAASTARKRMPSSSTTKQWGIDKPTVAPQLPDPASVSTGARVHIGWKYKYVWKDSSDGHLSSSSVATGTTGRRLHATFSIIVRGTTQARVTHISLYRTRDGGSTFYFLKDIANPGTDTDVPTTDAQPDSDLNEAIIAPGENSNNPPPTNILDAIYHVGRVWVITGNNVQCSTNLVDVAGAANASLNGVPEECFPPDLVFSFNAPSRLVSTERGLLVFTKHGDVHIISGTSKFDFDPERIKTGMPVMWKNDLATDGEIIYLLTAGQEILRIADGIEQIGRPISLATLGTFTPGSCMLSVRRKATKAALYISNSNNKVLRFGISDNVWSNLWEVDGAIISHGPVRAIYTSLGVQDVLYAPKAGIAGSIWKENDNTHKNDSEQYVWSLPWNVFTPSELDTQSRVLSIFTEASRTPTVKLRMAEISGSAGGSMVTVDEPPLQTAPTTISSKRHYPQISTFSLVGRRFQPVFEWDAVDQADELYAWGFGFDTVA